jgi:hypothetical protein
MALSRKSNMPEDDFVGEFDLYSDDFDDEEAMEIGLKPSEAAFLKGFNRHN